MAIIHAQVYFFTIPPSSQRSEARGDEKFRVFDIGGSLTQLSAELESGAEDPVYPEFQGPHDLEANLFNGVNIRLCNFFFANEVRSKAQEASFHGDSVVSSMKI